MAMTRPAGWYRNTQEPAQARYWDGAAWTNQYRLVPPSSPTGPVFPLSDPADDARAASKAPTNVMLAGSAAVAMGCFLPWAKITAPFVGTITTSGMEGSGLSDGIFFLGFAASIAYLAWQLRSGADNGRRVLGGLIVAMGALAGFEVVHMGSRFATATETSNLITPSYGSGIYLIVLGTLACAAGWIWLHNSRARVATGDA